MLSYQQTALSESFKPPTSRSMLSAVSQLQKHLLHSRTGLRNYECRSCDYHSSKEFSLRPHNVQSHQGQNKERRCESNEFDEEDGTEPGQSSSALETGSEKQEKCHYCHSTFMRRWNLKLHLQRIHGEEVIRKKEKSNVERFVDESQGAQPIEGSSKGDAYRERKQNCHRCQASFMRRWNLKLHLQKVHGEELVRKDRGSRSPGMSSSSASLHTPLKFIQSSSRSVKVMKECHAGSQYHRYKLPLREDKGDSALLRYPNGQFKCEHCGIGFMKKWNLKLHHSRMHESKRKSCPDSTHLSFKHSSSHILSLECPVCGKRLRGAWNLKKHLLIHTGEKPWKCDLCGMRFRQSHHLTGHLSRVHLIK